MIGEQQRVFWRLMEILQECDLSSKWMLIGSWSEVVYEKAGLLVPEWSALMVTRDVDFLIPEKTMRIDSDKHHIPLAKKLSESGFVLEFNRVDGYSRFLSELLEIEFLTEMKGDGRSKSVHKPTGIVPIPLRHLDILRRFPQKLVVSGFNVLVPDPRAYVVQKMMVNTFRTDEKREKDLVKIQNLMRCIGTKDFSEIMKRLSSKELSRVRDFCEHSGISFSNLMERKEELSENKTPTGPEVGF